MMTTQDHILPDARREAIAALGTVLNPGVLDAVRRLYEEEQQAIAAATSPHAVDIAYGAHERHRLDLYRPEGADSPLPVLVFVHGGGFLMGDKGGAESWINAHVGRWAAASGFMGCVINYRLAPDNIWPSGSEDVAAVVDWLKANVAAHGGDPDRIVLMGTSAGAVHVAGYLRLAGERAARDLRGAVLLSGLYGYTPLDERDTLYYGDRADYADRKPLEAVAGTALPLFVACAEYDPPRFQAEFLGLMRDRLERHGTMPRGAIMSGHNHYSMATHLGTRDRRLADEIDAFMRDHCR